MRCRSCNLRLESFDDFTFCKKCIKLSEDTTTDWKDPQLKLLTDTKQGCIITPARISRDQNLNIALNSTQLLFQLV